MGRLFETIQWLVTSSRYAVSQHAIERLDERGLLEWQVVDGITDGILLAEFSDAVPNPKIEVRQTLADGTAVKCVWSYVASIEVAKLVTVHYFDA